MNWPRAAYRALRGSNDLRAVCRSYVPARVVRRALEKATGHLFLVLGLMLALVGCTTTMTTTTTTQSVVLPASVAPPGMRTGAVCADGWVSTATGRGACSWHGGVAHWTYAEAPSTTTAGAGSGDATELAIDGTPKGVSWRDIAVAAGQSDEVPGAGADLDQIVAACNAIFDRLLLHTNMTESYRERFDTICTQTANG